MDQKQPVPAAEPDPRPTRRERVIAALRTYPGMEEVTLEQIRWNLSHLMRCTKAAWHAHYPHLTPEANKQIAALRRRTKTYCTYLETLRLQLEPSAASALHAAGFLREDQRDLDDIIALLRRVQDVERLGKGRFPDGARAAAAAYAAALIVLKAAGKAPTRSRSREKGKTLNAATGPFIDLLARLFANDVLDVPDFSVPTAARKAIARLRKEHPEIAIKSPLKTAI